jgi:hypothetical protein
MNFTRMNSPDVSNDPVLAAHHHCIAHQEEVMASDLCGCFYCLRIFSPREITEWLEENKRSGKTAFCPYCCIDAIIGSRSGYPITPEFLGAMQKHWFGVDAPEGAGR